MKQRWLLLVLLVFFTGIGVWAIPGWGKDDVYSTANRFSELGAAIAGGAVVAATVLLIERRYAKQTQNQTLRFEVSIEKDVSGIDLRGEDLKGSYWGGKKVQRACLDKAELDDSSLEGCDFSGTLLFGVSFKRAVLVDAIFNGSRLGGADFTEADLTGADLSGADLSGTRNPYADARHGSAASLAGANLCRVNLEGANLRGVRGLALAKNLKTAKRDADTIWPTDYAPPPYEPSAACD